MTKHNVRHRLIQGWHATVASARDALRLGTCRVCKSLPCDCPRSGLRHSAYTDGTPWHTDRPWLWSDL